MLGGKGASGETWKRDWHQRKKKVRGEGVQLMNGGVGEEEEGRKLADALRVFWKPRGNIRGEGGGNPC